MKKIFIIIQFSISLNLNSQIYSPKDSLALLKIDADCDISNNLNWDSEQNPLNWKGVTWDSGTPKRVSKLEIDRKSLTGVIDVTPFDSITLLNCEWNEIKSLLLTNLTKLTDINCPFNNLSYLDISTLNNLMYIICSNNHIARLEISDTNNKNLQILDCYGNSLTDLNFSALPNLKVLDITGNKLKFKSLAFPKNDSLIVLSCAMDSLQKLDVSNLTSLEVLHCYDNELTELNIDNLTKLTELECWGNSLTKLDLSSTTSLFWLGCSQNKLTELDISEQPYIASFDCSFNQLAHLNLGNYYGILQYFDCSNNQLTELDLSGAKTLLNCQVYNNKLSFSSLVTGLHAKLFFYNPQNLFFEPISWAGDTILDYSSIGMIDSTTTKFVFFKDGQEIKSNSTGLFSTTGSGVYSCEMSNVLFPDLVLKTAKITITEDLEIKTVTNSQLCYYPNPVTNVLHINSSQHNLIPKLIICSFDGKQLMSYYNLNLPCDIDLTPLKSGIYSVRLIISDSSSQFSIIKK